MMNLVPRTGGNTFQGRAVLEHGRQTGRAATTSTITCATCRRRSRCGPGIIALVRFQSLVRRADQEATRLWFWGSYRKFDTAQGVEGIFANKFALDPAHWDYLKDTTIAARNVQGRDIYQGRLTAQVTPKNRVMFSHEYRAAVRGLDADAGRRRMPPARR